MPRTRQAVAQKVADHLFALESAIDVALTRAAEFAASMPQARAEARLPAMIGQTALDQAAGAFVALVEARRRTVESHASLDQARLEIGLHAVASGDSVPKPPPFDTEGVATAPPIAHIRAVA